MTDSMFSVSHPTEGAKGTIIDNSLQWVGVGGVTPEETSKRGYFSPLLRSLTGGSCCKESGATSSILNPRMLRV